MADELTAFDTLAKPGDAPDAGAPTAADSDAFLDEAGSLDSLDAPYALPVRTTPRRSMGLVDNLAEDDAEAQIEYVHDSDYATGSFAPLSEQGYRRSRSEIGRLKEELHYGQYLSVPKGRRTIFVRNGRGSRLLVFVLVLVGLAVLVGLSIGLWQLIG